MNNKDYVILFKALADETRLAILDMLSKEELCACHILEEFDITQPTLSYHMKILVESGLVDSRKEGTWMRYRINADKISSINKKASILNTENKKIESRCD
jgi:ArsR family transcriptional regulator